MIFIDLKKIDFFFKQLKMLVDSRKKKNLMVG